MIYVEGPVLCAASDSVVKCGKPSPAAWLWRLAHFSEQLNSHLPSTTRLLPLLLHVSVQLLYPFSKPIYREHHMTSAHFALPAGSETRLIDALFTSLFSGLSGQMRQPLNGLHYMRTAR